MSYYFKVYQYQYQYTQQPHKKIDTDLHKDDWGWYIDTEAGYCSTNTNMNTNTTTNPYYVVKTWQMNRGEEQQEDDDDEEQEKKRQKQKQTPCYCNLTCVHILVHMLGVALCYFII